MKLAFLPTTLSEVKARGWDYLDIILITGDAYIDHPSFGIAIIGRSLEAEGFRVGIIPQPDWKRDEDLLALGTPRLFFGISSGNMDSMVNHYTAQRKLRHDDAYSPNGESGKRPDRAVIIYTNIIRRLFKGSIVVLGGIEASLRRIAHYDYWQDKIRNSILADSKADLLVYGMGENPIVEIARALKQGTSIK
ncbi:MAG TPA: YgiQ family radical SAM protein, partial [Candidatus Cloacimonadota bacterium]|nr:YgiQ family radical SAM protein [Candidatus Cloacimonadota bacterium]